MIAIDEPANQRPLLPAGDLLSALIPYPSGYEIRSETSDGNACTSDDSQFEDIHFVNASTG
jgi:hypothetical protein